MKINFKSLFFSVAAAMSVFMLFSFGNTTNNLPEKSVIVNASLLPKKQVHAVITSTSGCTFTIDGVVTYSIIPPNIDSFQGTIKLTGNRSGTYEFRVNGDINSNGHKIKNINWNADSDLALNLLQDSQSDAQIKVVFESIVK